MLVFTLFTLLAAATAFVVPRGQVTMCDVSGDTLPVPSTADNPPTPLAPAPAGGPRFIGLGVGVQNYSCASTGTYTSIGAVAELFDISCLSESRYTDLTNAANASWQAAPSGLTPQQVISTLAPLHSPFVLGQHYFIVNPVTGTGINAKWDFTSASFAGNPNAFVVGAKTGDVPAPEDPAVNVDWLSLNKLDNEGELADEIFRVVTRGGQPPSSCTVGSADISVRYVSQYWFYGGSF